MQNMNPKNLGRGLKMGMDSIVLDPSPALRNSRQQLLNSPDAVTAAWKTVGDALWKALRDTAKMTSLSGH